MTITVDGLPDVEIPGTVESVGDYGASTQGDIMFRVVAVPTGEVPDELRWNMTVTMEIEGEPGELTSPGAADAGRSVADAARRGA